MANSVLDSKSPCFSTFPNVVKDYLGHHFKHFVGFVQVFLLRLYIYTYIYFFLSFNNETKVNKAKALTKQGLIL